MGEYWSVGEQMEEQRSQLSMALGQFQNNPCPATSTSWHKCTVVGKWSHGEWNIQVPFPPTLKWYLHSAAVHTTITSIVVALCRSAMIVYTNGQKTWSPCKIQLLAAAKSIVQASLVPRLPVFFVHTVFSLRSLIIATVKHSRVSVPKLILTWYGTDKRFNKASMLPK